MPESERKIYTFLLKICRSALILLFLSYTLEKFRSDGGSEPSSLPCYCPEFLKFLSAHRKHLLQKNHEISHFMLMQYIKHFAQINVSTEFSFKYNFSPELHAIFWQLWDNFLIKKLKNWGFSENFHLFLPDFARLGLIYNEFWTVLKGYKTLWQILLALG